MANDFIDDPIFTVIDDFVPFTPRTRLTGGAMCLRELADVKARHPRGRLTETGIWLYLIDGGLPVA